MDEVEKSRDLLSKLAMNTVGKTEEEVPNLGDRIDVLVTDCEKRDKNKKFTVYNVVIAVDGRQVAFTRRYNEFLTLYDKMRKRYPESQFKLPGRKIFGKFDPEVIRTRRHAIKDFIEKLLMLTDILRISEIRTFLNLDVSRSGSYADTDDEYYSSENSTRSGSRWTLNEDISVSTEKSQMTPSDFEFLSVVGKGSFGRVFLAKHRGDEKAYAVKVLNKRHILLKNEVRHIMCERRVLEKNSCHPFLVGLHYSFQTEEKLYLVMDYINGGELFFHLQKVRRFSEDKAKFYGAEIASALGFLHSHKIIYRDLKPENILLDSEGHVVLTDFGLCKDGVTMATTFCGTPEYLAPEVLQHQTYNRMVDWWCLGAVLYELMYGLPPFYSKDKSKMFEWILDREVDFRNDSVCITYDARDFLTKMLAKNRDVRLGAKNDFDEIKIHPFFSSINWTLLEQRKISPPFVPKLTGDLTDFSNLDQEFTKLKITDSVVRPVNTLLSSILPSGNAFEGFSYIPSPCQQVCAF